jgi:hypothetical protein
VARGRLSAPRAIGDLEQRGGDVQRLKLNWSWYRFAAWLAVFVGLAAFANWPRATGIGGFLHQQGFPFVFAWGSFGTFESFSVVALTADVAIWLTIVVVIPAVVSIRRCGKTESTTTGFSATPGSIP